MYIILSIFKNIFYEMYLNCVIWEFYLILKILFLIKIPFGYKFYTWFILIILYKLEKYYFKMN